MSIEVIKPLPSNVRISFGGNANMWIYFNADTKPNKFQRWMLRKVFGIVMEDV